MEPPRKPGQRPIDRSEPLLDENQREFLLRVIKDQTDKLAGSMHTVEQNLTGQLGNLTEQFGSLKAETTEAIQANTKRILSLEMDRIEEVKTRLAVSELNTSVRELLNSNRLQDQDIGALKVQIQEAMRPQLQLNAELDGARAGKDAGKQVSRVWSGIGVVLSVVAVACMQYCQAQVENYRNGTAKAAPSSK